MVYHLTEALKEANKENAVPKPAISAFAQKLLQASQDDISERALQPVGNSPKRASPVRPSVPDVFDAPEPPQRQQTSDSLKEENDVERLISSPEVRSL